VSSNPQATPTDLRWVQPQIEPGYHELRDRENRVVSVLRFEPRPAVAWQYSDQRRARAEAGSAHWDLRIERSGFGGWLGLSAKVLIAGSDSAQVSAGPYFVTGTLEFPGGRTLTWQGGAARSASAFVDGSGRPVIRFDPGSIIDRVNAYVAVEPSTSDARTGPLMAAIGLYLRLAMNKVFK
jgi:hypothetical protein